MAVGWLVLLALGVWLSWPAAQLTGVPAKLAGPLRELQIQPSFLRSAAARLTGWVSPRLAERVSGREAVERRRLAAYQSLMAAGTNLGPAVVHLVGALDHPAIEARGFALRVLVNASVPADEVVRLARREQVNPVVLAQLCAGLLRDESGPVREFAWACLEAFTPAAGLVRGALTRLAEADGEPALRARAQRLLATLTDPARTGAGDARLVVEPAIVESQIQRAAGDPK